MQCQTFWIYIVWYWIFLYFYKHPWELCSGETIWSFQGLLFFNGVRAAFRVGIIWLHYRDNTLLSTLPDAPWIRRFPLWLVGTWTLPGPMNWGLFPPVLLCGFSPASGGVPHACTGQYAGKAPEGALQISEAILSWQPFLPVLNPGTPCLWISCLHWTPSLFSTWGDCHALPGLLFLNCCLETLSRQSVRTW